MCPPVGPVLVESAAMLGSTALHLSAFRSRSQSSDERINYPIQNAESKDRLGDYCRDPQRRELRELDTPGRGAIAVLTKVDAPGVFSRDDRSHDQSSNI